MMDLHIHIRDIINGVSSFDEYILAEIENGVNEVCFLEHGDRISEKHHGYLVDDESASVLKNVVESAKAKYPKLDIYNGIELDYSMDIDFRNRTLEYLKKNNFDIVIGSIHCYKFNDGKDYFNSIIDMINNYPIDIIGHIKLRENWREYVNIIEEIIRLCSEKNIKIEINTSDRSLWNEEQFDFMLSLMKQYNVNYTIGSDAHHLDEIGKNYKLVMNRLDRSL